MKKNCPVWGEAESVGIVARCPAKTIQNNAEIIIKELSFHKM